jgi:monoamine oxidase
MRGDGRLTDGRRAGQLADVAVLGAGLAGLSCARDLANGGADVVVLEARDRAGGRVEQVNLPDGRTLQMGGEVVAEFHTAYLGLAAELGLTLEPSYASLPGASTWGLPEGVFLGEDPLWLSKDDLAAYLACEQAFRRLTRTVDPDDPWSHPDAERLDRLSFGAWMLEQGCPPEALRAREIGHLALACDSIWRTSLLSEARKMAVSGGEGFYSEFVWETLRVAEGSATVALRMAEELGDRIRFGCAVTAIDVAVGSCTVTLQSSEGVRADAVVSAIPAGPLRDLRITGLSEARLASLRRQRHALAAKVVVAYPTSFWLAKGQNGFASSEAILGGIWPQRDDGVLSTLVPPERLPAFLATSPETRRAELLTELAALFGPEGLQPDAYLERTWGVDPYTKGYITGWHPGDVMAVGPLHGTHEPPFFVCGSDQWVAGYMEGAVRTGRGAAQAALTA